MPYKNHRTQSLERGDLHKILSDDDLTFAFIAVTRWRHPISNFQTNLEQIVKDSQQVLEGRVLGDLAKHRVEGLGQLARVFPDEGLPGLGIAGIEARYEVEVVLADHLRPSRINTPSGHRKTVLRNFAE